MKYPGDPVRAPTDHQLELQLAAVKHPLSPYRWQKQTDQSQFPLRFRVYLGHSAPLFLARHLDGNTTRSAIDGRGSGGLLLGACYPLAVGLLSACCSVAAGLLPAPCVVAVRYLLTGS